MTDWETVTIRVDPETKGEWEEYAEEHEEVANLSHLVRYSVSQEMTSETTETVRSGQQDDERIGELLEEVKSLSSQIVDLEEAVSAVQRETQVTSTKEVQHLILENLPVPEDEEMPPDSKGVTAGQLAEELGRSTGEIHEALGHLDENVGLVKKGIGVDGDTLFWWKTE